MWEPISTGHNSVLWTALLGVEKVLDLPLPVVSGLIKWDTHDFQCHIELPRIMKLWDQKVTQLQTTQNKVWRFLMKSLEFSLIKFYHRCSRDVQKLSPPNSTSSRECFYYLYDPWTSDEPLQTKALCHIC